MSDRHHLRITSGSHPQTDCRVWLDDKEIHGLQTVAVRLSGEEAARVILTFVPETVDMQMTELVLFSKEKDL